MPAVKKHKLVSSSPRAGRSRSSPKCDDLDGGIAMTQMGNAQRKSLRMYLREGPATFVSVCQQSFAV